MALINCPECRKPVSDKATTCPNCGFSIENHLKELSSEIERKKKIYNEAIKLFNSNNPQAIAQAKSKFESIIDWEDANDFYDRCDNRIESVKPAYDSSKKRLHNIIIAAISAAVVTILLIILVIIPLIKYSKDISFFKEKISVSSQIRFGDAYEDVLNAIKEKGYSNIKYGDKKASIIISQASGLSDIYYFRDGKLYAVGLRNLTDSDASQYRKLLDKPWEEKKVTKDWHWYKWYGKADGKRCYILLDFDNWDNEQKIAIEMGID